jgi:23S rRNA pseudouridine1911/1915/1917 synthase
MIIKYIVKNEENDKPLKYILRNRLLLSGKNLRSLKVRKKILVNDKPEFVNYKVRTGDIIKLDFLYEEDTENIIPFEMDLKILYEDSGLIAIDKPANIIIHPLTRFPDNTLSNALKYYYSKNNIKSKIRPVGRLDRDTTGIVLFAKNAYVQHRLVLQMRKNTFIKEYTGVLQGNLKEKSGTIDLPVKRVETSIIERTTHPEGSPAKTHYEVLESFNGYDLVKFVLETGRTHQIRVHTKAIGHPIAGDTLYSETHKDMKRQALHASFVSIINPVNNKNLTIKSELPNDMKDFINKIRNS